MISAISLRNVDKSFYISYQAWLNQQVQATKQRGKKMMPYFKSFDKFFDYEKEEKKVWRSLVCEEVKENKNNEVDIDFLNIIRDVNNG